jgi:transcriptional regulator with XRE-family HTH domain
MYAIPEKLKEFREAKGLTQVDIANLLNMEQTTYGKKENGRNSLSFETAIAISKIIEKDIMEFTTIPEIVNSLNNSSLTNSSINVIGDVTYNNCTNVPDKIISLLEETILLFKTHFKSK